MWGRNFIRNVYFNSNPLSSKDYDRSRTLFIQAGASSRIIMGLTSGAFLAGFAKYMGAKDEFNGIIAAIPALAGAIQIVSPMVFEKLKRRKFLISILCLFHRLILGLMVFIPLIVKDTASRLVLIAACYFLSYLMVSFIAPAAGNWIINLTQGSSKGKYFGIREFYMLISVTVVTLVMGRVMDIFKQNNSEYTGFVIVFATVLVLAVLNFYFLSSIREPPVRMCNIPISFKKILTLPLKDRRFRKIVILFFLWSAGFNFGGPFFAVYMVAGLNMKYTYIMVMGLLFSATSILLVRFWGKVMDKRTSAFTTKMCILILSVTHIMWFFVNIDTAYMLVPILYILGGVAFAGINISMFNIQFEFSPEEGRTVYIGFSSALGGVAGFICALGGSALLGILRNMKLNLLGIHIGNMQVVFVISGLLLAVCALYIHRYIGKHNV